MKSVHLMVLVAGLGLSMQGAARAQGLSLELFSLLTTATNAPTYTVTDLGTLGGSFSVPFGINNAGLVVGNSFTANDAAVRAFLIGGGMVKDVGTLGGPTSHASGINTAGQVVGQALLTDGQTAHAFLWTAGNMRDLGTLGGSNSVAGGINDSGLVCGSADLHGDNASHAFLWSNGAMQDLGALDSSAGGSLNSRAYAINSAGQVVGTSDTSDGVSRAFLWAGGVMKNLGSFSGDNSYGSAINGAGQVVGTSDTFDGGSHAFLWSNGTMTDLGTLGASDSQANSINASGQVVGVSGTHAEQVAGAFYPDNHAFLWSGGVMRDLNQLIPPGSGWFLTNAQAINDAGQIVGVGTFNGQDRAFLLTPR